MNRLFDKLAILVLCLIAFSMDAGFIGPVAALMLSAIASLTVQLFTGKPPAFCVILLWACLCGILPVFFCALPLMLYDALWEKRWWLALPSLTVLLRPAELSVFQFMLIFAGALISVIIYLRVSKLEETVANLTALRDEIAEKNIFLARQNIRLAEAQDNEIHLAELQERNRIAREIHDNVGHTLTRSLLQSGALLVLNRDAALKEPLENLKHTLDDAMTEIRKSVHDLHEDSIDLQSVIAECINAVDSRFQVSFDYDVEGPVPGKIKLCIAGIVKEGLSNAVKHSAGDRITVTVREHPGFYQLLLMDNGVCTGSMGNGIGLKNMEERADSVGGRLSVTPSENGFRVFLSVPKEQCRS